MEQIKKTLADRLTDFDPKKIKAIAIDIDGTLINSNIECSLRTEQAVKNLIKTGREVYIVTGRSTVTAMPFAKQIELPKYMINYNGAAVYNFQTNQKELEHNIDKHSVLDIIDLLRTHKVMALVCANDNIYYEIDNEYSARYFSRVTIDGEKRDLMTLNLDQIKKIVMMGSKNDIDTFYRHMVKKLGDTVSLFLTSPELHNLATPDNISFSLEVMAKGVNKGVALKTLLHKHNITMDEVVSFGDDNNDIEMLEMSGWGIAMNNARPAVKEVAKAETLSNNDDGVAYFIETYLL